MKLILLFLSCLLLYAAVEAGKSMGPVGNIIINSIRNCKEKPTSNDILITGELKNLDGQGNKAFFVNMSSKIPIDNTIQYNLEVKKWEGGGWTNFYSVKGTKLTADAQKQIPKLWTKLRTQIQPPFDIPIIKAGDYKLDKFTAKNTDFTIPAIFYGRFMVLLTLSKGKTIYSCFQGEGDSQAPSLHLLK